MIDWLILFQCKFIIVRSIESVQNSFFVKGSIKFKKYLFVFFCIKFCLLLSLYFIENDKNYKIDYFSFFTIWKNSTVQSPSQDNMNMFLYQKMKLNIIHTNSFSKMIDEPYLPNIQLEEFEEQEKNSFFKFSLFKIVLVRILSLLWKIFFLNSSVGNSYLLFLEKLVLQFHFIECISHFLLLFMMMIMMVSLRRHILKKRYVIYRMIILLSMQSYLRLFFIPNIHFTGFLLGILSLLSILYDEHFLCTVFFCLSSLNSMLSFEYTFPVISLIFLTYNLPKHHHEISFSK